MNLQEKIEKVKESLKDKKVAIAFSGGADSSLLCLLAKEVCSDVLAITLDNNILPEGFIQHSEKFCKKYDIRQKIIFEDFYEHKEITANNTTRCFLCRKEMYRLIMDIATENDFETVLDGTNISDLVEDRPGLLVKYENNIKSPFVDAQLSSKEIHEYLDKEEIEYSHSTTCLATRVPFGEEFTKEKYDRINKAEKLIYDNTNCKIVKVREKYPDCVCEVDDLMELKHHDKIKLINEQLKAIGYREPILKLEPIKEYDEIIINYMNNRFAYQLPYEIDFEKTKIDNENVIITEDGIILGKNCKDYDEALETLFTILPKIRQKL